MNPGFIIRSSSFQSSCKQSLYYLHIRSRLKQLTFSLLAERTALSPALLHSSKSQSKIIHVAGLASTGLRTLTAPLVKNCVDSSAAESSKKKMPPKRKQKQASTVEEEEKVRESKVKKLSDEVHKVGPDEGEERPPLSKGVHPGRMQNLKPGENGKGPVVYWMSRDHRSRDNWALLYAVHQAREKGVAVAVAFNLVDSFLGAGARHFGFMLRGLRVVERNLQSVNIPFFLFRGKAEETIPDFVQRCNASLLVMDYSSLRIGRQWRDAICKNVPPSVAVVEVDSHNVVPVWCASDKMEYGARTIRTKIQRQLIDFLNEYPKLENPGDPWESEKPDPIDWDVLIADVTRVGAEVPEVSWCEAGEDAALEALIGKAKGFINKRIKNYENRNDPSKPTGLSGLSPYLHYGHISAQRCALEARKFRMAHTKSVDAFLEELIVRAGLAENYCHYQPNYDNIQGAWSWARETLRIHANDKREFVYTREELEKGKTYDQLWNASQLEMVYYGKMHGFMRMYWAKKILEWTESPEEALAIAIYLNDKYELDGRDPNGYVGCMWSICGIHDQGWKERPVFGKIRYMNLAGCKRKFNVDGYIMNVNQMVAKTKKQLKDGTASSAPSQPLSSTQPI